MELNDYLTSDDVKAFIDCPDTTDEIKADAREFLYRFGEGDYDLIRDDETFDNHIEEIIEDGFKIEAEGIDWNAWPLCSIDWAGAIQDAKLDYMHYSIAGNDYLVRES